MSSIESGEIPLLGSTAPRGPVGIRGWLLFVAVVQVLGNVAIPLALAYRYRDPETQEVIRQFPLASYGELALGLAAFVLACVTTLLLFRKSRYFPRVFILQGIASVLVPLLQTAWVAFAFSFQLGRPFSEFVEIESQDIRQFVLSLIGAAIWITYTLRSKRVRNTFILGLTARDMHEGGKGGERLETPLLLVIGAVILMLGVSSIVFGMVLTINRGVFNGSIVGGAVQVALALWLLRGSNVARIILALLFGLGAVLAAWIAFYSGQAVVAAVELALALLCAGVFWALVFSKRFRAELEINAAKYRKVDDEAPTAS